MRVDSASLDNSGLVDIKGLLLSVELYEPTAAQVLVLDGIELVLVQPVHVPDVANLRGRKNCQHTFDLLKHHAVCVLAVGAAERLIAYITDDVRRCFENNEMPSGATRRTDIQEEGFTRFVVRIAAFLLSAHILGVRQPNGERGRRV